MISIVKDPTERTRFLKFMAVGTMGAVIDFGIANVLAHFFQVPLDIAGTISFICAIISNFTWNRYWTYPESRSRHLAQQLAMFFVVNVAGLAIRYPILHYGELPVLQFFQNLNLHTFLTPEFLARNCVLATAVGIVMLWNFFVNRYWTYNDV
jgi:putative flippase GtrA